MAGGAAALLHRGGGQGGEADDIADRVDMRHVGLVVVVDFQPAPVVRDQADIFQAQPVRRPLPPDAVKQRVRPQMLAGLQCRLHQTVGQDADLVHALAQAQRDAHRPHPVLQGFADLRSPQSPAGEGRASVRMTRTPRVAIMQAYSVPMTPPPTMIMLLGRCEQFQQIVAVQHMRRCRTGRSAGVAGTVPVAITTWSASISLRGVLVA